MSASRASIAQRLAAFAADMPQWRTRFAPAPTGWLHLGHAVNAVWIWSVARAFGGRIVLRVEDHDQLRCRPEYEAGLLDDLDWLGLTPDEGSIGSYRRSGPHPLRQSDRSPAYTDALAHLSSADMAYPCRCSRKDIARASGDVPHEESRYPGTCRHAGVTPQETLARRIRIPDDDEHFFDLRLGESVQRPAQQGGDVLVRDRHGLWTYQFAVVVDDLAQHIDVVIRGEDLLASTGRQRVIARWLGGSPPRVLHHPLVRRDDGEKLSKSNRDTGLRDLRADGWTAERVLGLAAQLAGLAPSPAPLAARDLAALWT